MLDLECIKISSIYRFEILSCKEPEVCRHSTPARIKMELLKNLAIYLYYLDSDGGAWTLYCLSRGEGVIDVEHLEPDGFYEASGGIRLFKDRIYCFLDTAAADDLVSYVYFLLSSLAGLWKGDIPEELEAFKTESRFRDKTGVIAKVHNLDQSVLLLRSQAEVIVLDFLDEQGNAPESRGSRYFQQVFIDPDAWVTAAILALTEYFSVARSRLADKEHQEETAASYLSRLMALWHKIIDFYSTAHS